MDRKTFSSAAMFAVAVLSCMLILSLSSVSQTETIIHRFRGGPGDGFFPNAQLITDKAGNFYGTTSQGGTNELGTVFRLQPLSNGTWKEMVLHSFSGSSLGIAINEETLAIDAKGDIYGTTVFYGAYGSGSVFKLSQASTGSWNYTVLHDFHFDGITNFDGDYPLASLIVDQEGNLYGTTLLGGTGLCVQGNADTVPLKGQIYTGCGTVFELSPQADGSWKETILYNFQGSTDGGWPAGNLTFDRSGNLYGTAAGGGTNYSLCPGVYVSGCGLVFELQKKGTSWNESVLYTFSGDVDGGVPYGSVVIDKAGNLYGSTGGWQQLGGSVYELSPTGAGTWTETTLVSWVDETAGFGAVGDLQLDDAGNIYGTTQFGSAPTPARAEAAQGSNGAPPKPFGPGTIFEVSPNSDGTWSTTWLHTFGSGTDGVGPAAGLIRVGDVYYGTTYSDDGAGYGTVFKLVP